MGVQYSHYLYRVEMGKSEGEVVGTSRVDPYGDKIVSQNLTGGGWTRTHDAVKSELNSCCVWAGLQAVCEPFGLFGQFLPQQPLNRME